jgi:predicted ATPase/class 3 adenylate cyclase
MNQLPTGTVTFLFTDIEGSTRLVQNLGDAYEELLAEHCRIMRGAIAEAGGTEVGTEGDSFFAVFPSATAGVAATVAAQRALAEADWPGKSEVRVRMGLHTGEGRLGGDNYIGLDVHRAARIAAAGHGGQVLLSDATRSLVAPSLPGEVRLRDLGAHRLKDLVNPEHLFQLEVPGLAADFPALRSLDARPNNLPAQLTSFIGRHDQITAVGELLERSRLVTLTGPGGTGKTRLAVEVAAGRLGRYGDGAFFVELAPITDPALVPTAIAAALNLREAAGQALLDTLKEYLGGKEMLLVFDNFEQVTDAASIVTDLLAAAPRLGALVTSRATLHVHGEQEYPVPPMRIPDADQLSTTTGISDYEGVALFIERAIAVRPGFSVTNESAPAIAEIVARVDGLPLAIELAAAKAKLMGPEAILGRLGSRLAFLSGGARDLPARQQTLRQAIDWSYALLTAQQQAQLRRLGVFVGGFDVEAAAAILGLEDPDPNALDALADLVDQSLIRSDAGARGEPRFGMLETIREFALERLDTAGESPAVRRRHAEHFLRLAEATEPELTRSMEATESISRDHDNFRAALVWAIESGDVDTGLRLGYALWRFWQQRGHFREARDWFDRLLALPGADAPTAARAKGLTGAAGIAYWQNDYPAAIGWYTEAEEIIRGLGDRAWLADALYNTGTTAAVGGDMTTTIAKLQEGITIGRELHDDAILGRFLQAEGYMAFMGDDLDHARPLLEEALAVAERGNDQFARAVANHTVGQVARLQGRLDDAARRYREALRIGGEFGDAAGVLEPLQSLAAVVIAQGDAARGVRWLAAAAAIRNQLGGGPPPEWLRLGDPLEDARSMLDEATYQQAWQGGSGLSVKDAIAEATGLEDRP